MLQATKLEVEEPLNLKPQTRTECDVTGFVVCPAQFWFRFGSVFPHYSPLPLRNGDVYFIPLYVGNTQFPIQGVTLKKLPCISAGILGREAVLRLSKTMGTF